jgi:hypothetical protein
MYYVGTYHLIRACRKKLKQHALHSREYRKSRHEFYRAMLKFHKKALGIVKHFRL